MGQVNLRLVVIGIVLLVVIAFGTGLVVIHVLNRPSPKHIMRPVSLVAVAIENGQNWDRVQADAKKFDLDCGVVSVRDCAGFLFRVEGTPALQNALKWTKSQGVMVKLDREFGTGLYQVRINHQASAPEIINNLRGNGD